MLESERCCLTLLVSRRHSIAFEIHCEMANRHGTFLPISMHGVHQEIWSSSLLYASECGVCPVSSFVWLVVGQVGVHGP
jgi:hypothetical protein